MPARNTVYCATRPRWAATTLLLGAMGLTLPSASWAQSWEGSLGLGAVYAPDYLGSDDYDTSLWPVINLDYGDRLSISPRSGIEWHAVRNGDWTVSPFIGYTFGRDNEGDISRFEKVDGGATLGLRISLQQKVWHYSVEGSTPFTGDVDGAHFSAAAGLTMPVNARTRFSFTPRVSYADDRWANSMLGVSSRDSLRSGVAAYEPDSGYWQLGVDTSLSYALTPEWSATGFIRTSYLTGDAADSPIVDELGSQWQNIGGLSLSYLF